MLNRMREKALTIEAMPGFHLNVERGAAAADRETRFESLVRRQSRFVFQVAFAILRNAHDAEDVVQETFLKLYQSVSLDAILDERAFLARAAWRLAVGRLPKRREVPSDPGIPAAGDSPEEAATWAQFETAVHRIMDALPEKFRQVLALSAIEGLTSAEIAVAVGVPEGTVRTRIMRAREMVREKMRAVRGGCDGL